VITSDIDGAETDRRLQAIGEGRYRIPGIRDPGLGLRNGWRGRSERRRVSTHLRHSAA